MSLHCLLGWRYIISLLHTNTCTHIYLFIDISVAVDVVHVKSPFEFGFHSTSRSHCQSRQKLGEIHLTVIVSIETSEHLDLKKFE